jgi:hypothetical protein
MIRNRRVAEHPMPSIFKDEHGNLLPYVFQEYPKDMLDPYGEPVTVNSKAEELALKNKEPPTQVDVEAAAEKIQAEREAAGARAAKNPSAVPVVDERQISQINHTGRAIKA